MLILYRETRVLPETHRPRHHLLAPVQGKLQLLVLLLKSSEDIQTRSVWGPSVRGLQVLHWKKWREFDS